MNPSDTRAEFQRRRATTWRLAKPWQAIMAVGWVTEVAMFAFYDPSEPFRFELFFLVLVVIGISIGALTYIVYRHYRCPACNVVPRSHNHGHGVLLNPSECPECSVPLK